MSTTNPTLLGSYRQTFTTGAVTTIAAGTATAGHILALRFATAGRAVRIRQLDVEFILTTAFGAAQEVGYDAYIARSYTVAHSGGSTLTIATNDGKSITDQDATPGLAGFIANASALTAGTHTFDANAIARGSLWAGAIGASTGLRSHDFTTISRGGILLQNNEGIVVRNTILMGATGVGKWHFTVTWDQLDLS